MNNLVRATERLVGEELERASEKFGVLHHSAHEAYAVIFEEMTEAFENMEAVENNLIEFWTGVMKNDAETQEAALETLEREAMLAACEFIQVSAMAKKARLGYARKENRDE